MGSEQIIIRVFGEPRPFPKKETGKHGIPFDQDYRTKKCPVTGKLIKYDKGYKRRWMTLVTNTVLNHMAKHRLRPFPKNHPVAMSCLFFITKAPSCKLELPSQAPDFDNFAYAIWNAIKRSPSKKIGRIRVPGRYPNGVLVYEDDQIIWTLEGNGVLWATEGHPPGVIIRVESVAGRSVEFYRIADQMESGVASEVA